MDARFAALMLLYAASGAAFVVVADNIRSSPGAASSVLTVAAPEGGGSRLTASRATLTGRIELHREVAELDDVEQIVARARAALARPRLPVRDLEVVALLERLFELTPARAAELTATLDLPQSLLETVFRSWAEVDVAAAIALLDQAKGARREMLLALAIIDVAGEKGGVIEQLLAAGQTLDSVGLTVAALVQQSTHDPRGAVSNAQGLIGQDAQEIALEEIARSLARLDPSSAIAAGDLLTDWYLSHEYRVALFRELAVTDGAGLLEHLDSLDPRDPWAANLAQLAFDAAPVADPRRALESADRLGGAMGDVLRSAALERLAQEDITAALEYVESTPFDDRREALLAAIAEGYARFDLDGAVAWVKSLSPQSADAAYVVTAALASVDLSRAVDFDLSSDLTRSAPGWLILRNPALIADRIVADGNGPRQNALLQPLMQRWIEVDPYAALTWLRANENAAWATAVVRSLAARLGARNVHQALDLASIISPSHQFDWIQQALRSNAAYDVRGALEALTRFRNEPFYGQAMGDIVVSAARRHGPAAAAALLDHAPAAAFGRAAVSVAIQWSNSDAPAAAAWAATVPDPKVRLASVQAALERWVQSDVAAASRWAQGLADNALREQTLSYICDRAPEAPRCGA